MGNSASSSIFIQCNYLNSDNCIALKAYLIDIQAKTFDVGKGQFGFHATKIPIIKLTKSKEDIKTILNTLNNNGFIRVSGTENFHNYQEYRKKTRLN